MASKKRAIVIFPGRGSYAAPELGYLQRHHASRANWVAKLDHARPEATPVAELDGLGKFSPSKHLPGRNASNLIYTCAQADYAAIDREKYDIVGICGNSLGWYLTLAAAGALSLTDGAFLVDTMGHLMESKGEGGQLLYTIADEDWRVSAERKQQVFDIIASVPQAHLSIDLSGTLVLAGSNDAIKQLQTKLKSDDGVVPPLLPKHAAFHTPLLDHIVPLARERLQPGIFRAPEVPIIDGRGHIWSPSASDLNALYDYTLGHQLVEPYDFAKSVEVALKEFAPDCLVLAGPGSLLGAPIGQCLVAHQWQGMTDRAAFMERQTSEPFLLAMGREEQRALVL